MTKKSGPLTLRSHGQPRRIIERMRPAFREHVRPHTKDNEGERLGGGLVLNTLWHHRETKDVDTYLRLQTRENPTEILDKAAKACGAYRIEHPTFKRLEFERDKENHIDVTFNTPTPEKGELNVILDGEPTTVLNTAQIITGKLLGRGMTAPVRDLYDITVCRLADPRSLDIAVNNVPNESLKAILRIYKALEEEYKDHAKGITKTPAALRPVIENPTGYALNAVIDSRYKKLTVRTHDGHAIVETETADGAFSQTYENAEALIDGMERHGTKAFLAAQERDTETIRDVTIDQMWLRTTETVVEVRPPALEHQRVDLPGIDWQPPVLPRIRPAQIPKGPAAAKSGDKPFPVRGADAPVSPWKKSRKAESI
ncbi:MAG: nucleotidyl transferase AbiEii/AbiGii toxin family protein [Gemmatimonadetes bacterium]|nr:nucleotidyl transferase AbiEii/AbiGii toxin family protein [Gemmatimonadota bacterium]